MHLPNAAISLLSRCANGPLAIFAGRGVYAAAQFATLAAVARCCGAEAVGDVVLGLAVAVPSFVLFGGQLRIVQATDPNGRFAFGAVERWGLLGHSLGFLLVAAIAFLFRSDSPGLITLLGVGLARAAESWSEIAYGALQRQRSFAAISLSTAVKSVASCAIGLPVLILFRSPGLAFAASGIVWLAGSVLFDRPLAMRRLAAAASGETSPGHAASTELLKTALPLSAGATVSAFDTQAPRYFVEAYLGSRALGLFGVTHYAALSILTLIIPLTYVWTPALAKDVARGDGVAFRRRSRRALLYATALAAATALFAIPAGPVLASLFAEPSLAQGWTLTLTVAAAGALAPAAMLESMLRAAHGFRLLCTLQIASLIVHAGACTAGLGWFGLEGVAGAMLLRSVVYLTMLAVGSYVVTKAAFRGRVTEAGTDASDERSPDVTRARAAA
ncbi:MAG TPA: hypothetical protein VGN57_10800 [Pirellulaceae bacterium]|nr:hypothetical protein [Pirellulaceae bacterium]